MALGRRGRERLRRAKSVSNLRDFRFMARHFERPNIVSEGDSWFAYPRSGPGSGSDMNLIDHIASWAHPEVNLLRLASSGDEATAMLSDKQRHKLTSLLASLARGSRPRPVDVLLFSGGGNDVVGAWDFERFIKPHVRGMSAADHFHAGRISRKLKQIELAYRELLDIRNEYSPDTVVITHTYDKVFPSDEGSRFFGIELTKPWVKIYMERKGITDPALQKQIVDILIERIRATLLALPQRSEARQKLIVVDTVGTLPRRSDWLNEIHPKQAGFRKVARKLYTAVRTVLPQLPAP